MTSLSYTREDAAQSFAAMSHLRLGSPQENIEDAKAEGIRLGSKLKPAQVLEIVALKRKHGIKN